MSKQIGNLLWQIGRSVFISELVGRVPMPGLPHNHNNYKCTTNVDFFRFHFFDKDDCAEWSDFAWLHNHKSASGLCYIVDELRNVFGVWLCILCAERVVCAQRRRL
jgi:hypothetical protein